MPFMSIFTGYEGQESGAERLENSISSSSLVYNGPSVTLRKAPECEIVGQGFVLKWHVTNARQRDTERVTDLDGFNAFYKQALQGRFESLTKKCSVTIIP